VARPVLEVADILRDHGSAWRDANQGHVSLGQLKVMRAIERCRTAALGGHVARCENAACGHTEIAYNSCGNRHCPKCQGAASRRWLADREAELLPVPYFHVVYTLPSELRDIAYQNKRVIYNLLMKAAAETTLAIASDPKRLGARIGVTAVLHTWGSAMTHHPHLHMIVPGGGLSLDGARWVAARSNFLVHVNVLARLFRGKMLAMLMHAHNAGELTFFTDDLDAWERRIEQGVAGDQSLPETDRLAIIRARKGQGLFKDRVREIESRCRITGVENPVHLVASHCKPWRDATNEERLDGENGLLLTPSIDHLFDRGFIGFEDNGRLIISPVAHHPSLQRMGIDTTGAVNVGAFTSGQKQFLDFHRNDVLLKSIRS
jgi:Transposase zinc-binding domain/Putative transposase/HNH endonuclease